MDNNDTYTIGIDPGLRGGIAVLNAYAEPVYTHQFACVDIASYQFKLLKELDNVRKVIKEKNVHVFIEKITAIPLSADVGHPRSIQSEVTLGVAFRILEMAIAQTGGEHILKYATTYVSPKSWQKVVLGNLRADKNKTTKQMAELAVGFIFKDKKLFYSKRNKPLQGVIDAALIAYYGVALNKKVSK